MAQKFWTIAPRYVNGKYVTASPEAPALVEFPDHLKIKMNPDGKTPQDGTLIPYEEKKTPPVEERAKPFAEIRRGPKDKTNERERSEGRPSDSDPAK
jgi:hypothetical protein